MSNETVNTDQLSTFKIYRVENGWVTEYRDGSLFPKVYAWNKEEVADMISTLLTNVSKMGIGPQNMRKVQSISDDVQKALAEPTPKTVRPKKGAKND